MLHQGGFVHVTPHKAASKFLSAYNQTAVGVYRTPIVYLTQAGMCVTSWLKCSCSCTLGAAYTKPQHTQLVGTLHLLKLSNFKYNDNTDVVMETIGCNP